MIELAYALHYASIAFIMVATSLGVGLSAGRANSGAIEALNTQPEAKSEILRLSFIGLALIETAAVFGLFLTFMLIGSLTGEHQLFQAIGHVGIALAIGISGFMVSLTTSRPIIAAVNAVARQPFFGQRILNVMLLTLSVMQAPIIFALVISIFIKLQISSATDINNAYRLLASGLCIGIGSIGPAIGLSQFAATVCQSIGFNRNAYIYILQFTLVSGAMIETPLIFSFLTAMIMLGAPLAETSGTLQIIGYLAAAWCVNISIMAASINSSKAAVASCIEITKNPESYRLLAGTSMMAQALIDAAAVYALIISIILIFL